MVLKILFKKADEKGLFFYLRVNNVLVNIVFYIKLV